MAEKWITKLYFADGSEYTDDSEFDTREGAEGHARELLAQSEIAQEKNGNLLVFLTSAVTRWEARQRPWSGVAVSIPPASRIRGGVR